MQMAAPAQEARVAAKVLGIRYRPLLKALSDRTSQYVVVAAKASPVKAAALEKKNLTGFTFQTDQRRVYPQGTVAAPVLGYMGVDQPLGGLETRAERRAAGEARQGDGRPRRARPGRRHAADPAGRERQGRLPHARQPHPGERRADPRADRARSGTRRTRRRSSWIRAPARSSRMAQEPGYNANSFPQAYARRPDRRPRDQRRLRAGLGLQGRDDQRRALAARHHAEHGVHRPGLAAGRRPRDPRRGVARHGAPPRLADPPALVQHRHRRDRGALPRRVGAEEVDGSVRHRAADGHRLSRREPGILPSYWSGSTIGTVPIGQGVSVTAIQLASVYSAIANNGLWMQPHLVDHVVGQAPAEAEVAPHPRAAHRPRAAEHAARRCLRPGDGRRRVDPRLQRRGQDGNRPEAGAVRLPAGQVRRDLRRDGAGLEAAARRPRQRRRAAGRDLRRPRRGAGVPADRLVRFAGSPDPARPARSTSLGSSRHESGAPRRSARAGGGAREPVGRGARSRLRRARSHARRGSSSAFPARASTVTTSRRRRSRTERRRSSSSVRSSWT